MKSKLCITYLSTGNYKIFLYDFFKSFDLNFCRDCEKTFLIFTDDINYSKNTISECNSLSKVEYFELKKCSSSPDFNKFRKFKILNEAETYYKDFDYIFYYNGNLICRVPITLQELFNGKEQYAVFHSLFDDKHNAMYESLCNNEKSASYFNYKELSNYKYYQSGSIGATYERWQKIIDYIESCRYYDKYHGYDKYVPWHDETYYNKCINMMYKKEPEKINILDGKMYLCTWLPQLADYAKKSKMLLLWKEYFWKTGKTLNDLRTN